MSLVSLQTPRFFADEKKARSAPGMKISREITPVEFRDSMDILSEGNVDIIPILAILCYMFLQYSSVVDRRYRHRHLHVFCPS